jgi:hypothetical protein
MKKDKRKTRKNIKGKYQQGIGSPRVRPYPFSGHLSSHGCRCSATAHIPPLCWRSAATSPCLTHADAAPLHLPPRRRSATTSSATASPLSWLTQVQRCHPSLVLLLAACTQPALRSFPTSRCCSLRSPSRSTTASAADDPSQAAPDLVGMSKAVATASPYRFPLLLARHRGHLYSLQAPCRLGDD